MDMESAGVSPGFLHKNPLACNCWLIGHIEPKCPLSKWTLKAWRDLQHTVESKHKAKRTTASFPTAGKLFYNNLTLNQQLTAHFFKKPFKLPTQDNWTPAKLHPGEQGLLWRTDAPPPRI
jgi:hypothetical protein